MLDVCGGKRLALETRGDLGVLDHLGMEQLDGDTLLHVRVLGEVHRTHAAFAEQLTYEVATGNHGSDA